MIKPVLLWTDALIFVLVAAVAIFTAFALRREYLRAPWRQVARSRVGMAALVVLAVYLVVGLLDSIHFRPALDGRGDGGETFYAVEVLSVLDVLAKPLRERVEKTYSAPFATHLYAMETVELPGGRSERIYPRLVYGGAHLAEGQGVAADVLARGAAGAAAGFAAWACLMVAIVALLARRRALGFRGALAEVWRGRTEVPWRVMLITAAVILALIGVSAALATHYHVFGTDKVGQDVFYQTIKSIRTALVIGTLTTLVMLPFAILLGIMAGYLRGWVDDLVQYVYTTLNSIPSVLLIASAILLLQVYIDLHPGLFETDAARADMRLLFLCVILGVTSWTGLCRLLRGETLKLREVEYVQAAVAFGVGRARVMLRHLLPNVMHIVLITVVLDFSGLVLAEAVLSYVGVGVDPSTNSWGNMINGARLEMAREPMVWWSLAAAFAFMFVLVLAANLFSDAVRDAFDPRLRRGD
jgi:peptide/nickel transport system permease protein